MGFIHIALFGFKTDAKVEDVNQLFNKLLALKENCVNADSGAPYIKSLVGGKDISVEELQSGVSHDIVAEFDTDEDRQYYLSKDPAHLVFMWDLGLSGIVTKVQVIDFVPGQL